MESLDPGRDVVAELDRLSERWRADPQNGAAHQALFRAVFALERWLFIARGDDAQPTPFAINQDAGPMLLAFTTAERARAGARAEGLPDDESQRLLAVPTAGAVDWVASFAAGGVYAIAFDHPGQGYFVPLAHIVQMRDWLAANPAT